MAVRLRALRDDEFDAYVEHTKAWFARQLIGDGVAPEQAREQADEEMARMLPNRLDSPDQFVFAVEDEDTGERVGDAWLTRRETPLLAPFAFVASIEIAEQFRRRGFAREAMLLLENEARDRGLGRISLNVYGANEAARALYRSLGYAELAITMGKPL
jgi:ribosomal protein S18 acetylase RimI-like enzyme